MKDYGLGQFNNIDAFVEAKLADFDKAERCFLSLFELMFRERDNIMFEKSEGYRIRTFTYGQSRQNILRRAAALKEILSDTEQGSVVGISMDNSIEWIEIFWAVILAGFNPLLINLRLSDILAKQAIKDAGAKAVISDKREYSVRTIRAESVTADKTELTPTSDGTGDAILVMSSGTSASVKICAYTAREFYYQIHDSYSIIKECKLVKKHYDGRLKQLCFLPFYHIFGLVAVYIWFAFFSRTFVQLNDLAPQTIVNTVKRHKITHIFAVPLFWETVYKEAMRTIKNRGEKTVKKFEKAMKIARKTCGAPLIGNAFSKLAFKEVRENLFGESISFLITGGSNISSEVLEFFNAIGYRLADGYGMSEIGITSVELSSNRRILNSCSVGKPMSFTEYKINEQGELLVKGKGIANYIIENGEKKATPEWFNTHDLAECENGRYRILGRRDDLIISPTGENLNPNIIEPVYDTIEKTNGVCLIGIKENGADAPVLIVSVNRYITADNLAVIEKKVKAITEMLNLSGEIKKIVFTSDALLQGEEFKLNRLRIKNDYLENRLTVVTPEEQSEDDETDSLMIHLTEVFALTLNREKSEISPRSDFFLDLGGSSLDYLAMTAKLQEEFGIAFPTSSDKSLSTVKDIYKFIKEQ
ncbi:MAG: AMP-binding protein [Ruminococcus sp.]|nr:AMP-binding protein [Ruminococcus sp.]